MQLKPLGYPSYSAAEYIVLSLSMHDMHTHYIHTAISAPPNAHFHNIFLLGYRSTIEHVLQTILPGVPIQQNLMSTDNTVFPTPH